MADKLHPFEDPARRCLPLHLWPSEDRAAWEAALAPGDVLDGTVGPGFHWREETRSKYRKGYGRWLTFLVRSGMLRAAVHDPTDRINPDAIRSYIEELQSQEVGSWTLWGRLAELLSVAQAMAPSKDFKWLQRAVRYQERQAVDRRDKLSRLQPAHHLLDWAFNRMRDIIENPPKRDAPGAYRDALMIGILACCPVRLSNLTMIQLDRHLVRQGPVYFLRFAAMEMKTGHPFSAPISDGLTRYIEHYISIVRSDLLVGRSSDGLWITRYGEPMTAKAIHVAVTRTTERAFGRSINPHLFRDCAATFVALEDPEHIGVVSPLLGHVDPRAAEQHYIQANQIVAGRRLRTSLAQARKMLGHRTDGRPA